MIFAFDDFELDEPRLELRRSGKVVNVDTVALRVLATLVRNAGRLVSKEELVQEVWDGRPVADNVVTIAMARLRKALDHKHREHEVVATVYGRGYRFVREVVVRSELNAAELRGAAGADVGPVLVGREHTLQLLRRAFADAQRGRGRLCVLLGEPGIGKTHVAEAFTRSIASETRAIWGFCREAGDTPPLFPWLSILRELLTLPGCEQLAPYADEPTLALLLRGPTLPDSGIASNPDFWLEGQQRHRAFELIARLLARAAEHSTLLFVIEDLHRADGATLEFLRHLLDELAQQRIFVIATARHAESPTRPAIRARLGEVLGHQNSERIALQRLAEADVHAYVKRLFGPAAVGLATAVFKKSEGNPFFMAELCRQLRDRDPSDSSVLTVPQAALELIRQHVARLDADARGVLSAAAVIGRSFELTLLQAITGQEMAALMASLDAALAFDVVIAAPNSATGFAFGHELLRDVLYDALAPAERRRWHVRVASVLDERARAGESFVASDIAYHLHAGLPESDARLTVHYCRLAAAAAATSFANDDVVRYARHAVEALELTERPSLRLRLHLMYLIAMYARGDSAEAYESASRELARLARQCDDGPMLVRAALMFNLHPGYKQLSGAGAELRRALELVPADDLPMRAVALAGMALSTPTCFSAEESGKLLDEAIPLARASGSRATRYVVSIAELQLRGGPDRPREANAVLEELEQLAQQNPTRMPVLPVDLGLYRAVRALQRGDLDAAAQAAEQAAAQCRRLHHAELLWQMERIGALLALHRGASPTSLVVLDRLHRQASQQALFGLDAFAAFDAAVCLAELTGAVQLDDGQRGALAYDAADPPALWSLKIRALASAGLKEEARTALRALAPSDIATLPCDRDLLGTLGQLARSALTIGALDYAAAAAERLRNYRDEYAAHIGFHCEGSVPHIVGAVALALGDSARAVHELEVGLELDSRAGLSWCAGYARLELGRALERQGLASERTRARILILAARSQADRIGMRRLARAATSDA